MFTDDQIKQKAEWLQSFLRIDSMDSIECYLLEKFRDNRIKEIETNVYWLGERAARMFSEDNKLMIAACDYLLGKK